MVDFSDIVVIVHVDFGADHQADDAEIQPDHDYRQSGQSAVNRKAVEIVDVDRDSEREHYPRDRAEKRSRELVAEAVLLPDLARNVRDISVNQREQHHKISEYDNIAQLVDYADKARKHREVILHDAVER